MLVLSNENLNTAEVWRALGSFYAQLSLEEKQKIEALWFGIMQGTIALEHNLLEAFYVNLLGYTKGYIEHKYKNLLFDINTVTIVPQPTIQPLTAINSGTVINECTYEYYLTGIQLINSVERETDATNSITIVGESELTDISITISWGTISSFDKLRLYKVINGIVSYIDLPSSSTEYIDNGEDEFTIVTSLPHINTTIDYFLFNTDVNTLYVSNALRESGESVPVEVINFNKLKVSPFNFKNQEVLVLETQIVLAPIFNTIFATLFNNAEINFLTDYITYFNYDTNEQKAKLCAQHLLKLCNAVFLNLKKGLTINRLAQTLSLYYNVPFNYETGEVLSIINNTVTVSGTHVYDYVIPSGLNIIVASGQTLTPFSFLTESITVDDYISNPSIMPSGYAYYNTIGIHIPEAVSGLSYISYVRESLLDDILPPNCSYKYY